MELLLNTVVNLSHWSRGHLHALAAGLIASLLVLLMPHLSAWLRRKTGGINVILRVVMFGLVYVAGYGLTMVYVAPRLAEGMNYLNNYSLAPLLLSAFVLIGVFADRH